MDEIRTQAREGMVGTVRPTLFIGLGGTGKEILLRIRRKFYEEFGTAEFPCVRYLWIDTDTRDVMAYGEPITEVLQEVAFTDGQKISILTGNVGTHLSQVFSNRNSYPHIHEWLYPEVETYGAEIHDGAGNTRAVGRLCFFYHYDKINEKITAVLDEMISESVLKETVEILKQRYGTNASCGVDYQNPQIYIISSVAGGTGAGTLLDTCFLVRKLTEAIRRVDKIYGILVLPNVYFQYSLGDERICRSYGNAYAALCETEFFTRGTVTRSEEEDGRGYEGDGGASNKFNVAWRRGEPEEIQGPPFSICFLLERDNEKSIGLSDRRELFEMIAESIFLNFLPTSFANSKRSRESNIAQYLAGSQANPVEVTGIDLRQSFARRYASFGFSKIEIPVNLIRRACAAQLCYDIVAYWNRPLEDKDIQNTARNEIKARGLQWNELERLFGEDWKNVVRKGQTGISEGAEGLGSVVTKEDVDKLRKKLDQIEEELIKTSAAEFHKLGYITQLIRRKTPDVRKNLESMLDHFTSELIEKHGIRALLDEQSYFPYCKDNFDDYHKAGGICDNLKKDAEQKSLEYRTEIHKRILPDLSRAFSMKVNLLGMRQRTIEILRSRLFEDFIDYLEQKVRATILLDETKSVSEHASQYLDEMRETLQGFQDSLNALKDYFAQRKQESLNFRDSELFIRIFDPDKDWEKMYKLSGEPPSAERQSKRFLQSINKSLFELVGEFQSGACEIRRDQLRKELVSWSEESFLGSLGRGSESVNVFEHNYFKQNLVDCVQKLARRALPRLQRVTRLGGIDLEGQVQKIAILGVGKEDERFVNQVRRELENFGYRIEENPLQTGDLSAVYLFTACYAFPLPTVYPIISLHCDDAYFDFYARLVENRLNDRSNNIPLHIDKRWEGMLPRLKALSEAEARELIKIHKCLLFGAVLKVVQVETDKSGSRLTYSYLIESGTRSQTTVLGPKGIAMGKLMKDNNLRDRMLKEIEERERQIESRSPGLYYLALSYLYETYDEFAPERALLHGKLISLASKAVQESRDLHDYEKVLRDQGKREEEVRVEFMEAIKNRLGNGVIWREYIPILKDLDYWTLK